MKFGLLYEMETPRPWHALSEYNTYWEALAQIELADRVGFDYVWEVEHHFLEENLEYEGKLIKVPPRRVVPKPIQKPHPPMWMACVAPDSYEMAGDRGLGVLSFNFNWDQVRQMMETYRKACAQRSHQIPKVVN